MDREDAASELQLIHRIMTRNRRLVVGTWRHQVWWAAITTVGMAGTWWAGVQESWDVAGILWLTLVSAGWLGSWFLARDCEAAPLRNAATRSFTGIWIGVGVALSLLGLVGLAGGGISPGAVPGVVAALLGGGYMASGQATGIGWLAGVGVAWWVASVPLLAFPGSWSYLALSGLVLVLQMGAGLALAREEVGQPTLVRAEASS